MNEQNAFTIIDHQTGNLAFKLFSYSDNTYFDHLQYNNFYSLLWIQEGAGLLKVDFSEYSFEKETILAFAPFQPFMISTDQKIKGIVVQFHSDFYCIHRNPKETNCDAVLFNNIYQAPILKINTQAQQKLRLLIDQLKAELNETTNDYELIVPTLKIILVSLSRLKAEDTSKIQKFTESQTPYILEKLKLAVEGNFKTKHSASDYADALHISPNALAKLVKKHFNKTLSELIAERIIIEAKRELYLTSKPVKQIAWNLGYTDEFYFSRFFKTNTGISPQTYRESVGFGKSEES